MADHLNDDVPFEDAQSQDHRLVRTLMWIGIAGLGAAVAYTAVRVLMSRPAPDPTTQRIQSLIDEANELLRTLDDRRSS